MAVTPELTYTTVIKPDGNAVYAGHSEYYPAVGEAKFLAHSSLLMPAVLDWVIVYGEPGQSRIVRGQDIATDPELIKAGFKWANEVIKNPDEILAA